MKLKYIFASIVATLALAVGCQKEADHYLAELKLSTTYVSLPVAGGSVDVTAIATDAITVGETPDWLTVSVATGTGTEGKIRFEAGAGEGRTAEVKLTCAGKTQLVNVIQGLATVSTATCAQVIAGPDAKTYRVTGVITSIANTTYGNWYLKDDTGEVYIYGTLDAKGNTKNFLSLGLEVGDEVTVEGPKTTYNGTVELVDVTVIKINKSLIKVEEALYPNPEGSEILPKFLPKEGGEVFVALVNKGETLKVTIPEEDQAWLGICEINGPYVTFKANANEGGDRETTVTFATTQGNKAYSCQLTIPQKGAVIAASVAEFLAAPVGNTQYRLTGTITKVAKADYGNVYIKDYSGEVYVYGIGAKGDFDKLGLKEGDIVTLVGKRGEHSGNAQMTGGQHESHISVTTVTVAEFLAAAESKEVFYRITGKVTKPTEEGTKWDIETYGNLNLTDASGSVYVYGVSTGVGGETKKFGTLGVKEGDTMTIIGYRTSHKGLNQVGGGMYVSHEAAGEGGEEGDGKYVQVTADIADWAGTYLIVWDDEAHGTASNKDLGKTTDVTISEGVITASTTVDAAAVTVTAIEGGYSICLNDGKFLTFTTNGNQCTFADAAAPLKIVFGDHGVMISGVDSADNARYLLKNASGDTPFFRGYKSSSFIKEEQWQDAYSCPTLFKYTEEN